MLRTALLPLLPLLLGAAGVAPSPYAGLEGRDIKALPEQQAADLRAGRGMGLALAAELNGWPGPMHVLELGEKLGLSAEQRAATEALFGRMRMAAQQIGGRILAEEASLDAGFRERRADAGWVGERTAAIGRLQGELRAVHLAAHLEQAGLLTEAQRAAYARLRGYGGDAPGRPGGGHGHRHGSR